MAEKFGTVVIGSGPGGYVAAIRAAQLGQKVAIVERESLGGVCLNWGCIPTKALLQSTHVLEAAREANLYGIDVKVVGPDLARVVARSREVAATMSRGVQFLLNKANVAVIPGTGMLEGAGVVRVTAEDQPPRQLKAEHIIIATGARPRALPNLPIDGEKVISYRQALALTRLPESMAIIGSGAIGAELAQFYHTLGTQVTLIEALPNLLPLEDDDVSRAIGRAFRKVKMKTLTNAKVLGVDTRGALCQLEVETAKGVEPLEAEVVLSAVGVAANIENLGLEQLGVATERGKILVDEHYRTNVPSIYAIGDVIPTPALAHVASAEATHCAEVIAGGNPPLVNYAVVPACTYTTPEVASVGARERDLQKENQPYLVGNFPFTASGKATALGAREGFVKLLLSAADHRILGAHIVGTSATEMIAELALAMQTGVTAEQLHHTIHPHPTLSEAVMEATAAALGCCAHL